MANWFTDADGVKTIFKVDESERTYRFAVDAGQGAGGEAINVSDFSLSTEGQLNILSSGQLENTIVVKVSGTGELTITVDTSPDKNFDKYVNDDYVDCDFVEGNSCFIDKIPFTVRFKEKFK